jgi:hypothetical protein
MNFTVVVPEPIRDEIRSWGLSIEAEDKLYEVLENELRTGHEEKCSRLAAPAPTYLFDLEFQDPCILGITHSCTFWLTYGPRDDALYVMHCTHSQDEHWDS